MSKIKSYDDDDDEIDWEPEDAPKNKPEDANINKRKKEDHTDESDIDWDSDSDDTNDNKKQKPEKNEDYLGTFIPSVTHSVNRNNLDALMRQHDLQQQEEELQKKQKREQELKYLKELKEDTRLFDTRDGIRTPAYIKQIRKQSETRRRWLSKHREIKLNREIKLKKKINKETLRMNVADSDANAEDANECYVIITCHGTIDIETKIHVPLGKNIIKKNQAACGYAYASDNAEYKPTAYEVWLNNLKSDIDKCGDIPKVHIVRYNLVRSIYDEFLPNISKDNTAIACNVMRNKLQYYNKTYTISTDEFKHLPTSPYYGITFFIGKRNYKYEHYGKYNIMFPQDLEKLFRDYTEYIHSEEHRRTKYTKLLKLRKSIPVTHYREPISIFNSIDTRFIFKIFDILPFTTFTIFDASCQIVPNKTDPSKYVHPTIIDYDYSDANPIGFGGGGGDGRIIINQFKSTRNHRTKNTKTHKKKYNNIKHGIKLKKTLRFRKK